MVWYGMVRKELCGMVWYGFWYMVNGKWKLVYGIWFWYVANGVACGHVGMWVCGWMGVWVCVGVCWCGVVW